MPKKTPEPEQAPKADNYAKINMPAAFLTPHDIRPSGRGRRTMPSTRISATR